MAREDYEILPSDELEYLRHEVDKLKRNPLGDTQASVSLLESMNKLTGQIEQLVTIFQSANDDLVKQYQDQDVQAQIQRLRQENAKIAHGIVALSEMIKKLQQQQGEVLPSIEEFVQEQQPPQPPEHSFDANELEKDLGPNPFAQEAPERPKQDSMERQMPFAEGAAPSADDLKKQGIRAKDEEIPHDEIPPPPPK